MLYIGKQPLNLVKVRCAEASMVWKFDRNIFPLALHSNKLCMYYVLLLKAPDQPAITWHAQSRHFRRTESKKSIGVFHPRDNAEGINRIWTARQRVHVQRPYDQYSQRSRPGGLFCRPSGVRCKNFSTWNLLYSWIPHRAGHELRLYNYKFDGLVSGGGFNTLSSVDVL